MTTVHEMKISPECYAKFIKSEYNFKISSELAHELNLGDILIFREWEQNNGFNDDHMLKVKVTDLEIIIHVGDA